MTTDTGLVATDQAAYQAYTAEERRLRAEYIAACNLARAEYTAATRPARDAYDAAERTAWKAYYHATRWNYRTYQAKCGIDPDQPIDGMPPTPPPAHDDGATYGCDIPAPRPTFTPNPESRS